MTRMYHIQNSVAADIPPGCLTSEILLPPTFHPDVSHPKFCCHRHSTRMSHIRNSAAADIPPGCLTSRILLRRHSIRIFHIRNSDAGWERRAFQLPRIDISGSADSAYPESFATIFCTVPTTFTRRISQPFLHSAAVFS